MVQFRVNSKRLDPYTNLKFRVMWNNRYVAGVRNFSALKRTTDAIEHREGGDPSMARRSPGITRFEPITIERGVTPDNEFEKWDNKVYNYGARPEAKVSLEDFRKDIIIDLFNEAGQKALSYKVYRCWVSEYQALPELDADDNAVAIDTLTLQNQGWERDYDVIEPAEPSFTEPESGMCPLSGHCWRSRILRLLHRRFSSSFRGTQSFRSLVEAMWRITID